MHKRKKYIVKYVLAILVLSATVVLESGKNQTADAGEMLPEVQPVVGGKVSSTIVESEGMSQHESVSAQAVSGQTVSGQAVSGGSITPKNTNPCVVTTLYGEVEGKKTKKAYQWLGIPYGQTERWQAPTAPDAWTKTLSCKKSKKGKGDDCLFLNIYKPLETEGNVPVMVFLHGGGNVGGSPNRDFKAFVEETKVIVVSIEFRQGAFGWLNSRGLQTGNKLTDSGNFAMLDIKLALEWIKSNIGAFGGDSNNVTLSGFSAGARDSLNCMISPITKGLFHKVISFSGGMTTCSVKEGREWSNEKLAKILVRRGRFAKKKKALKYVKRLSKKKLKKLLYSLTDKEIKNMTGSTGLRLTNFPQCFRDGRVIPKEGFEVLEYGEYNRVPVLIGCNNSEFANVSYKAMRRILLKSPRTFKNRKEFYRLLKKAKEYGSKLQSSFYLEQLAIKIARDPYHSDMYTYRFKWGENKEVVGANYATYVGAIHGMDVDFLLGKYKKGEKDTSDKIYTDSNLAGREDLTSVMRQYMKNFLYTGNPNGTDAKGNLLTQWDKWRNAPGSNRIMMFSATKTKAKAKMTSKYIQRAKVKKQMKRKLSKKAYKLFTTRILSDRFFM